MSSTGRGDGFDSLQSNRIHLWVTPYRDGRLDAVLPCLRALLTDEERARERRFLFPDDQRRFLVTRALLRITLSRYADVRAQDWRFQADAYGKPGIVHASGLIRRLQFNLTHTGGLIVLAVSLDRAAGVDAECAEREISHLELAGRYFTPYEAADVGSLRGRARTRRFFEYWTLKEAYVKARGQGLSIALDQFGFQFPGRGVVDMLAGPAVRDSGANWHFWQWSCGENYLIALCVRADPARDVPQVECRRAWPLIAQERHSLQVVRSSS